MNVLLKDISAEVGLEHYLYEDMSHIMIKYLKANMIVTIFQARLWENYRVDSH